MSGMTLNYIVLPQSLKIMHLSMFPPRGVCVWGGIAGDYTAKTVTALGNLTDDFGTGTGP